MNKSQRRLVLRREALTRLDDADAALVRGAAPRPESQLPPCQLPLTIAHDKCDAVHVGTVRTS